MACEGLRRGGGHLLFLASLGLLAAWGCGEGGDSSSVDGNRGAQSAALSDGAHAVAGELELAASAPEPDCDVDPAACCPAGYTIVALTDASDTYQVNQTQRCILGKLGDDTISDGSIGPTAVIGGPGNDVVTTSNNGADLVVSGAGADNINTFGGNDQIFSGAGSDTVDASLGNDVLYPGPGIDDVTGSSGDDEVRLYDCAKQAPARS